MCMNKSYLDFTVENAIMVFIEVKCHCISKILLEIFHSEDSESTPLYEQFSIPQKERWLFDESLV